MAEKNVMFTSERATELVNQVLDLCTTMGVPAVVVVYVLSEAKTHVERTAGVKIANVSLAFDPREIN